MIDEVEAREMPGVATEGPEVATPELSDYRLLNWMMRPHLDSDQVPADVLRVSRNEVLMAFLSDSATENHP